MSVASVATPDVKPVLKRSLSDLEADTKTSLSSQSPAKRPKVQFSSENKIFTLKKWDEEKTLSLVREEVRRALEKHVAGEHTLFDGLRETLTTKPSAPEAPSATLLKRYVIAITGLCGVIGRRGSALVKSIIEMHWLGRDEEFVRLYQRLLANLISTYGGYSHEILESLVDRFTTLRQSAGRLPNETIVRRPELLERIHGTIEHILDKVPSSINELQMVLRQSFPHTVDTLQEHMDYVNNILRVARYAKSIKADIVAIIFDKVTIMDTNMQQDILDLEDELQELLEQDLSHEISLLIDKDNDDENDAELSDSDDESVVDEIEDSEQKRLHMMKQQVAKLDGMMELLFKHFEPSFSKTSINEQSSSLDQLFGMFARMILPTNKTRFVQFLLFHYAQSSEQLAEQFVQSLIAVLKDRDANKMIKRSASAYLASFIARGAQVTRNLVEWTFYTLGGELDRLRDLHEKNPGCGPDVNRFGTYYTIFQCLMYIFCFRWRDLVAKEVEEDQFDVPELTWSRDVIDTYRRHISSKLNPLKVCAQAIVKQFAIVVRQLEVLFLEPKLEQNKRIRLTRSMFSVSGSFSILAGKENSLSSKVGEEQYQLDAYFPFDPYTLPLSKRWVEGEYNAWRAVPGFEVDEVEDDDSEVEDEEEEGLEDEYDEPTETESIKSR
jgi:RNA polymerase I-specific transcription initiation factor RRN3